MNEPGVRIEGIVATDANIAVIFRRGPAKVWQQLIWDLNTDEVIPGQWIKANLYPERMDVSPDGKHLVVRATDYSNGNRNRHRHDLPNQSLVHGWTAISRPPYFTAIALWFCGDAWNGGGIWESNDVLSVNGGPGDWYEATRPPAQVKIRSLRFPDSESDNLYSRRLRQRGWTDWTKKSVIWTNPEWVEHAATLRKLIAPSFDVANAVEVFDANRKTWTTDVVMTMDKTFQGGYLRRVWDSDGETWLLFDKAGNEHRRFKSIGQWIDLDARGRVIFGCKGCLWAWSGFPKGEPTLIADLNGNVFEQVPPPAWAKAW